MQYIKVFLNEHCRPTQRTDLQVLHSVIKHIGVKNQIDEILRGLIEGAREMVLLGVCASNRHFLYQHTSIIITTYSVPMSYDTSRN